MEKCVARRVTEMKTRDIIVIGTSGGGLTALRELMRELPRDLPAAVFIVQHVDSLTPSVLPSLLQHDGQLEVSHPTDRFARCSTRDRRKSDVMSLSQRARPRTRRSPGGRPLPFSNGRERTSSPPDWSVVTWSRGGHDREPAQFNGGGIDEESPRGVSIAI